MAVKKSIKKNAKLGFTRKAAKAKPNKKVVKAAEPLGPTVYIADVITEIEKDKNCKILASTDNQVVICKKIELTLSKCNNSSVFQPRDYTETKTYCVMVLIEIYGSRPHEPYEELVKLGCQKFKIRHELEVENILKAVE